MPRTRFSRRIICSRRRLPGPSVGAGRPRPRTVGENASYRGSHGGVGAVDTTTRQKAAWQAYIDVAYGLQRAICEGERYDGEVDWEWAGVRGSLHDDRLSVSNARLLALLDQAQAHWRDCPWTTRCSRVTSTRSRTGCASSPRTRPSKAGSRRRSRRIGAGPAQRLDHT
ncbi:hypothetical protein ACFQZ4_05850 [Catellatospora coxensis]